MCRWSFLFVVLLNASKTVGGLLVEWLLILKDSITLKLLLAELSCFPFTLQPYFILNDSSEAKIYRMDFVAVGVWTDLVSCSNFVERGE